MQRDLLINCFKKPQDICSFSLIQQLEKKHDKEPMQSNMNTTNMERVRKGIENSNFHIPANSYRTVQGEETKLALH